MQDYAYIIIGAYIVTISLLAVRLTLRDKHAARKRAWRIKENTLLLVAGLGGSIAMWITMCVIRHKTKHAKFMLGIPVIVILQIAMVLLFVWWSNGKAV